MLGVSGKTSSSTAEDSVAEQTEALPPTGPGASALLPALALLVGVLWLFAAVPAATQELKVEVGRAAIEGIPFVEVRVWLKDGNAPEGGLTVTLRTEGSATEGVDYTLSPKTLTFVAGVTEKMVTITIVDDDATSPWVK